MTDAHGDQRPAAGAAGRPPSGGPRPRRDREQTRTALLAAAERLWAERGIHGASLDDIAAAAGLTKGAVYSNFAGKTDLLLALMERITSDRTGPEVCDELRAAERDAARDAAREAAVTGRPPRRGAADDRPRRLALLLVEFWLYGMRDYAAGWRIADWYAERRDRLARELEPADGGTGSSADGGTDRIGPGDRAALTMALDFGLAFQHLLDPARVPADLYATGKTLVQAPRPDRPA
ncbi:helix-turn-helix transcriptional regulator [Actinomadura sp. NAK00032]|uniref:helix-turn-helix domain-containing protein n=1 Tax=Actinomadura sp. NAK00032 TaxID=2742128 RepID=UPI0015901B2C|nr:helix-turn-helix domain-containing protein [Actinomadura sp. NAK00032]QKW39225.1 helix-turn-helix transcriptional regulator [Actinomadura sp. NAK00032]